MMNAAANGRPADEGEEREATGAQKAVEEEPTLDVDGDLNDSADSYVSPARTNPPDAR